MPIKIKYGSLQIHVWLSSEDYHLREIEYPGRYADKSTSK
jgi:hypothetical protein